MNTLYTLLFTLALPFILIRLWWRGRRVPAYREKVLERLGYYNTKKSYQNSIWLHAVSYGEAVAAEPLITALLKRYPERPFVVTNMTPTGAARIAQRFGEQVIQYYVPYDLPGPVKRFFRHVQPSIGIIMETEIWPNLLKVAKQERVPILLANARLSEHSYKNYARLRGFVAHLLKKIDQIAAQSEEDALRFKQLGADPQRLSTSGNIKFDVAPRPDLWEEGLAWRSHCDDRPVWMAASTHPGEEEQVLEAHRHILEQYPQALLILAPRHTDRAKQVLELCRSMNLETLAYTQNEMPTQNTKVFLVDVMGRLPQFYRASDVAFVGGSLVPIGGHNIIETASAKAAIIVGPHMHNSTAIAEEFKKEKASLEVKDAKDLAEKVLELLNNPEKRQALIQSADVIVQKNSGALDKLLNYVEGFTAY